MLSCSLVISNGIPDLLVFIFDKVILKCREIQALEALLIVEVNIVVVIVFVVVVIVFVVVVVVVVGLLVIIIDTIDFLMSGKTTIPRVIKCLYVIICC